MHKKRSMYSGRVSTKGKSVHWHKSVYANEDDDETGFLDAVEEEKKDMQDERLQGSDFLVSTQMYVVKQRATVHSKGSTAPADPGTMIETRLSEEVVVPPQENQQDAKIALVIKDK